MALDSITVNANLVATDKDGSNRHWQYAKIAWGADDTQTGVDASNPLPVTVKAGVALIGQVDVHDFPASSDVTDSIVARADVAVMASGLNNPLTVKFAVINRATSGDGTAVVAAVTGKKIRVLSYDLVCTAANAITWKSGSTAISGAKSFAANGGQVKTHPQGVMETAAAQALNLNLGSSQQVSGELSYVEV